MHSGASGQGDEKSRQILQTLPDCLSIAAASPYILAL